MLTSYLRDIDRDYAPFNEERTAFYTQKGLNPLPASTGIQAKLCRPELLGLRDPTRQNSTRKKGSGGRVRDGTEAKVEIRLRWGA